MIGSNTENFDPATGIRTSRIGTGNVYDPWGNTLYTDLITYTGAADNDNVRVETVNTYTNDTANWRLSRMTNSTVTHTRNGQAVARATSFDYDMAGPATGFLKTERISPNGAANQDMRKEYNLDVYGNRTASFSCSASVNNCKTTTLDYSLWDVNRVHRYSRVEYDSRGRYVTGTFEPFNTPGQSALTEHKTQTVVARDKYGEITHAKDVNGVSVVSQRSAMGRDYWSWVQSVPDATAGNPSQGIDSYKTYRYCGTSSNQVLCPFAAKFREQVVTDAAPKHWTYFDVLKRPVMEITQTFNDGITGKDFSAVCKSYDINGQASFVSDPFFLSATHSNGEPSFGGADPCAGRAGSTTTYDVLGRPTKVVMSDASQSIVQYDRLKTTTTNNLGQNKIEEKNALGELVRVTDNLGFQTNYAYDAGGNLATVSRNAGRGDIVTTMQYDSLGRKTYMKDPDAGEWYYAYYPSGEVENQYNPNEAINRLSRYDYRGRLVWAATKNRNDVWESVNVSSYDTAANGVGQISCSSTESEHQYRAWQGDTSKSANFSKCQQYDSMGRATTTTTTIDDTTYYQVARYDDLSRLFKSMDPSGKWTKTEFTPRGSSIRVCESSDADTDPACASKVATTYVETLETDARGNVVKEQRGGTNALQVTRDYNPLTGALIRTCAGNDCQIVDENLQWDSIGNLQSRDIAQKYREEYSYDGLNRLTDGRFARLENTTYSSGSQPISSKQTYDALGNICSKTVLGDENVYHYGGASGCGLNGSPGSGQNNLIVSPHAVQETTNVSPNGYAIYSYDSHGNQIGTDRYAANDDRTIDYTANDQAYQIKEGRNITEFWYAPDNQRYKRVDTFYDTMEYIPPQPPINPLNASFALAPETSLFSASGSPSPQVIGLTPLVTKTITIANLEIVTSPSGMVTMRRTVAGVMLQETVYAGTQNAQSVNRYLFHNHQGSVIRIAEADGTVVQSFDYSPFGERRNPTVANPNGLGYSGDMTKRGYTGHEMLDSFGIVHMNGRIYDSRLGRFLQADPVIQDPSNTQNFNRYTYVWNNPLAYTDPSGFISVGDLARQLAGIFIASYLPGASFWGAGANGALANISAGFIGGVVSTGNLQGGLAGAFSSGVMYAGSNREPLEGAVTPDATKTPQTGGKYAVPAIDEDGVVEASLNSSGSAGKRIVYNEAYRRGLIDQAWAMRDKLGITYNPKDDKNYQDVYKYKFRNRTTGNEFYGTCAGGEECDIMLNSNDRELLGTIFAENDLSKNMITYYRSSAESDRSFGFNRTGKLGYITTPTEVSYSDLEMAIFITGHESTHGLLIEPWGNVEHVFCNYIGWKAVENYRVFESRK